MIGKIPKEKSINTPRFYFPVFCYLLLNLFFSTFCSSGKSIDTQPARGKQAHLKKEEKKERDVIEMRREKAGIYQTGVASWYGGKFHGRRTANGEIYDMNKLTAAHKELPFNTIVEVENRYNRKKVIVRINDRGPFVKGRIIDLSYKAAGRLGMAADGTAPVNLRIVGTGHQKPGVYEEPPEDTTPYKRIEKVESVRYYIQAGAFGSEENARRMVQRLTEVLPQVPFGIYYETGFYKVRTEAVYTRSMAEYHKKYLEGHGIEVFVKTR